MKRVWQGRYGKSRAEAVLVLGEQSVLGGKVDRVVLLFELESGAKYRAYEERLDARGPDEEWLEMSPAFQEPEASRCREAVRDFLEEWPKIRTVLGVMES